MPATHPDATDLFTSMVAYLWGLSKYEHVPPPSANLKHTGFTAAEEQLMLNSKFVTFTERPRGSVFGFKAAQFAKGCSRPVWNCYIKEHFEHLLPHYHMQPQSLISAKLAHLAGPTTIFVQFDFASYYDQFKLARAIIAFFCFLGRNGETFALNRLPMGFTLACAIAQATTWQLLNFECRSKVFTCIDNVAFAGTPEDVAHDVKLFLSRCLACNATLNDWTTNSLSSLCALSDEALVAAVTALHQPQFSFLNVAYNWPLAQKSLPESAMDKLVALRWCINGLHDHILPRQLAAVLGFLRYAANIFAAKPLQFFDMLAWSRRVGAVLQSDVALWDSVALVLPAAHKSALLAWIDLVAAAQPVPIFCPLPQQRPPTIIFDASAQGWGAVRIDENGMKPFAGRWPAPIHSSVQAEPLAALRACTSALDPRAPPPIVFLMTDHEPLVSSSYSSAPRAFTYNSLLLNLRTSFPSTRFVLGFLPGHLNLTDSLSRGGSLLDPIDPKIASDIAGTGWLDALNHHSPKISCLSCVASALPWQN